MGDPRFRGDVGDPGGVIAVSGEHRDRRLEDEPALLLRGDTRSLVCIAPREGRSIERSVKASGGYGTPRAQRCAEIQVVSSIATAGVRRP